MLFRLKLNHSILISSRVIEGNVFMNPGYDKDIPNFKFLVNSSEKIASQVKNDK